MKKILSLFLASLCLATQATFMEKVKALPETAKEFGTKTINAAKANKPKAVFTTLQLAVGAHTLFSLKMPSMTTSLLIDDKNNFFSFGQNSPLGRGITKLYFKAGRNPEKIKNQNLRPIKYVQDFFNNGIGGTLFILEILKRLTTKAE